MDIDQIKREALEEQGLSLVDVMTTGDTLKKYAIIYAIDYLHSRGYLGGVPDGYVCVPKQPTTEILNAMCDCDDDAPWIDLWEAAIAAAPKGETK